MRKKPLTSIRKRCHLTLTPTGPLRCVFCISIPPYNDLKIVSSPSHLTYRWPFFCPLDSAGFYAAPVHPHLASTLPLCILCCVSILSLICLAMTHLVSTLPLCVLFCVSILSLICWTMTHLASTLPLFILFCVSILSLICLTMPTSRLSTL